MATGRHLVLQWEKLTLAGCPDPLPVALVKGWWEEKNATTCSLRRETPFSSHLPASEPKGMLLPMPPCCAMPSKCHWTLALVTKEEIASGDYSTDSSGHKQPNFPQRQAVYAFCCSEPSARNWIFANKRRLGQDINPASAAHSCCPLKESPDKTFKS